MESWESNLGLLGENQVLSLSYAAPVPCPQVKKRIMSTWNKLLSHEKVSSFWVVENRSGDDHVEVVHEHLDAREVGPAEGPRVILAVAGQALQRTSTPFGGT